MADEVYTFTGAEQTTTVPTDVSEATIEVWGAQGGDYIGDNDAYGGDGGRVKATVPVTEGETLYIYVGEAGEVEYNGGWNGGAGIHEEWRYDADGKGCQGGGASDVRQGGNTLNDRILVAGGGGGAGRMPSGSPGYVASGGDGGGSTGGDGDGNNSNWIGHGGTQSSGGGAGVTADVNAEPGTFGNGGIADHDSEGELISYTAGGGGGGWYGGGGAASRRQDTAGGGGGSGYVTASATNTTNQSGVRSGDGRVEVTWKFIPDAPTGVAVSEVGGDALLEWTDGAYNDTIEIHRSESSGVDTSGSPYATVSSGVEEYTDTGVNEGVQYHYRLVATNSDGESGDSSEVSITMTLPAPSIDSVTES